MSTLLLKVCPICGILAAGVGRATRGDEDVVSGTLRYLRAPLERNIAAGDRVLVLTDTAHDPRVWQAILTILADIGCDATLALFDRRPADYFDPPATVCEAMLHADVNILLTTTGMLHSAANFRAMQHGVRAICLDGGMTLEMFQDGAVTEDLREMALIKHRVATRVFGEDARECRVTSQFGTDLTYSVEGRIHIPPLPGPDYDPYKLVPFSQSEGREAGADLRVYLFPAGELNIPPVEGSANGRLVIDLTIHHIGRLYSPIELTIRDGRIVEIEGGAEARMLRDHLEQWGDENAYTCPAEASVGINRRAKVRGIQREDKNIFGAMHFGLGTNIDVGGTIRSNIHMDGVILAPTLWVDGEKRIEHGRFLVPVDVTPEDLDATELEEMPV
jgi:2,5-dihydroxypyridine 5,6-dioxygenase